MSNSNKAQQKETEERFVVFGEYGNPYEFNILPIEGSLEKLADNFCEEYAGVFILVSTEHDANGNINHKMLHFGTTDSLPRTLRELSSNGCKAAETADCICYYYEPSELIRNDAKKDILAANRI